MSSSNGFDAPAGGARDVGRIGAVAIVTAGVDECDEECVDDDGDGVGASSKGLKAPSEDAGGCDDESDEDDGGFDEANDVGGLDEANDAGGVLLFLSCDFARGESVGVVSSNGLAGAGELDVFKIGTGTPANG